MINLLFRLCKTLPAILTVVILSTLLVPPVMAAGNNTMAGSLELVSTFECIGVYANFSNDDNGNNILIATLYENGTTETTTMGYDALNRNTSWTKGTNTQNQVYRGVGWVRCGLNENGTLTKFQYDGNNVFADINNSGTVIKNYVTPFLDQNVMMVDNTGTVPAYNYYSQDGLGSVRTITDSSAVVQNKYDYTAFGEEWNSGTSSNISNRYTYTGREKSSVGSPMYYRTRPYLPNIGMMLNRNPWGNIQKTFLYMML